MQRKDRLKVVPESLLHVVPAVASDEDPWSSTESIAVCSEQNPKRTEVTSKRFEEVNSRVRTRNFRGLFG